MNPSDNIRPYTQDARLDAQQHAQRQDERLARTEAELTALRSASFNPRRRRGPGLLVAALLGAGIAAVAVSSWYDDRSLGQRVDATVSAAGEGLQQRVDNLKSNASAVAVEGAATRDRLAAGLSDAGITAAVKTALAADPTLSALKIEVETHDGVVTLAGPAPDDKARDRAAVLAAAPDGVRSVDNRLVVATGKG